MKTVSTSLLALLLSTSALSAKTVTIDEVLTILEGQGFDEIQVSRDGDIVTIEAEGSGMQRELVYDSGELVSDVTETDDDDDDSGNVGDDGDDGDDSGDDGDDSDDDGDDDSDDGDDSGDDGDDGDDDSDDNN